MKVFLILPRDKELRNLLTEGLRHIFAPDVGNALERQRHVHGVAGGEVILDALDDQLNEFRVTRDEHRDEQITLQREQLRITCQHSVCDSRFVSRCTCWMRAG